MTRLLIVDNDDLLRSMLSMVFSDAGYQVQQASNGQEALDIHRREPVDIVIAEMVLPEKDGFEMLAALRGQPSAPKFIAVTGVGRFPVEHYLRAAEQLGAHYVLAKPFQIEQLMTAVHQIRAEQKRKPPVPPG